MTNVGAFDTLAAEYDLQFTTSLVGREQRRCTRKWLSRVVAGQNKLQILEINCGTGEDALWLSKMGHEVIATDQSPAMIAKAKQKAALQFLQEQLFKTPKWIIDNEISSYTGDNKLTVVSNLQSGSLNRLVSATTLNKLFRFEAEDPTTAYTATEMLTDLRKGIWSELAAKQSIDIYRRNLQKAHVEALNRLINPDAIATVQASFGGSTASTLNLRTSDAISVTKAQLRTLASEIRTALPLYKDANSRAHLQDVLDRMNTALDSK